MSVFADRRASVVKITETVRDLIDTYGVTEVLVDLESPVGVLVAATVIEHDVSLKVAGYLGEVHGMDGIAQELVDQSAGTEDVDPERLAELDGIVVVIPAMIGTGQYPVDVLNPALAERTLDIAPTNRVGTVLQQFAEKGRGIMIVDAPERGLVSIPVGDEDGLSETTHAEAIGGVVMRRRVFRVAHEKSTVDLSVPEG